MTSHAKLHRANIIGQIQGSYSNIEKSITPTISITDFVAVCEEGKKEGNIVKYYSEEIIKGFCATSLDAIEKSEDGKEDMISKAEAELACLEKFVVVSDNNTPQTVFINTLEKGEYKDNAFNRFMKRDIVKAETEDVEKSEGARGGKVIGHTKSGKAIYADAKGKGDYHSNFTKEDHEDAAQHHRDLMRKHNEAGDGHLYHRQMAHRDTHIELGKKKSKEESATKDSSDLDWKTGGYGGEHSSYKLATISRVNKDSKDFTVNYGNNNVVNASSLEDAKNKIDKYTEAKLSAKK